MNFTEIVTTRQSCRAYDPARAVEEEKLARILESARLAPSAVNMQPWRFAFDVRSMSVLSRSTLMGKKYAGYDRGIAMLHATVGAAREGRDGRWQACENGYQFK